MDEKSLQELFGRTQKARREEQEAVNAWQDRIIAKMVATAHRETDRLEHHLLEMPLSVIVYQWVIIRLKHRPWRLLIPVSVVLTLLLQGILSRFNLFQLLTR
jgi:hypothetical protein